MAAIGLLAASLNGGALAAPQRLQEIKPAADSELPGYVAGMAAAPDGTLYTVDARNALLGTYSGQSATSRSLGGDSGLFGGGRLGGVAVADDGVLVVTSASEGRVRLVRPDGTELAAFGDSGSSAGQLRNPRGVAVSANRRVYVADRDNGRIAVFSRDGVFLRHIGGEILEAPEAVGVNAGEQLFVLDRDGDGAVIQFDETGAMVNRWSVEDLSAGDVSLTTLSLGPDNVLYVADAERSRVFVLDRAEGRLVEAFGSSGTGAGQFDRISALAGMQGARVAVADSGNGKIEIYRVAATTRKRSPCATPPATSWRATAPRKWTSPRRPRRTNATPWSCTAGTCRCSRVTALTWPPSAAPARAMAPSGSPSMSPCAASGSMSQTSPCARSRCSAARGCS